MNSIAMGSLNREVQDGISGSISEAPPTHYTFKIKSFSLLTKYSIDRYESGDFEAGGYKWKLVVYPNGNKKENAKEHISIYLALSKENSLQTGWEVSAVFRLFLLDQNKQYYIVLQEDEGREKRFNEMKLEWGFDQFMPLKAFNDASNGYLVEDTCVFGAEVFVCKERSTCKGESLSMIKDAIMNKHLRMVENISKSNEVCIDSSAFNAGDQKWKIKLYPTGKGEGWGTHLSLYLALADPENLPPGSKMYADFTLRILERNSVQPYSAKASYWFSASSPEHGWPRFILLTHFKQNSGFFWGDRSFIEAEVTIHGVAKALS